MGARAIAATETTAKTRYVVRAMLSIGYCEMATPLGILPGYGDVNNTPRLFYYIGADKFRLKTYLIGLQHH